MTDTLHPEIPKGMYCYTSLKVINIPEDPHALPIIKVDGLCPHWKKTEKGARCEFLNEEHNKWCGYHLVWDQVKECGINREEEYYNRKRRRPPGGTLKNITCRCGKEMEVIEWKGNPFKKKEEK